MCDRQRTRSHSPDGNRDKNGKGSRTNARRRRECRERAAKKRQNHPHDSDLARDQDEQVQVGEPGGYQRVLPQRIAMDAPPNPENECLKGRTTASSSRYGIFLPRAEDVDPRLVSAPNFAEEARTLLEAPLRTSNPSQGQTDQLRVRRERTPCLDEVAPMSDVIDVILLPEKIPHNSSPIIATLEDVDPTATLSPTLNAADSVELDERSRE